MKNRWLLNALLAVVAGTLVLIAIYRPGTRDGTDSTPLTALAVDSVAQIRLQRPKQPEVDLQKREGVWRLVSPRAARANEFRVQELAALAAAPVRAHFAANTGDLGKYGLDRPLATVYLNNAEIRFGTLHPLSNDLYVLHDGEVRLIAARHFRAVTAPVEDLLSPKLIDDNLKILALRLPAFSLKQNELGAWVRTPELKGLTSDQVNRFVDEWRHARALSVNPVQRLSARDVVTISGSDGNRPRALEFAIVARSPELILVRRDERLEYRFPGDAAARLLQLEPEQVPGDPAPAPSR